MNEDYEQQESTEEFTEEILRKDDYLVNCLKEDNIDIVDIINFKKYTIVDNDRPKLCSDRLDGVILTGIGWTKNITLNDIDNIIKDIEVFINEYDEKEIGFKTESVALKVLEISKSIDIYCHSNEDNYMMLLLAKITKLAIEKEYIKYDDLYVLNEEELFDLLKSKQDNELINLLNDFFNIKEDEIPKTELSAVKIRKLNPLINNKRLIN